MIEKDREQEPALNFEFLRAKGVELIQQYAGKNWSDFNLHDPGVTILEYLCYALTDVAYRTTFPIADILADKEGQIDREKNFFFPKEEVLSSGPVTINDYRKLLIDAFAEVDNVWLEPVTTPYAYLYNKGIYKVIIKPSTEVIQHFTTANKTTSQQVVQSLIQTVKEKLADFRNIGDYYASFQVLQPQPVYIKAEIIIERSASPANILAQIFEALEQAINPPVTYHTEAELLAKGYAIEEIYSGPLLQKGIILDSELKDRITHLDPFILTKVISGLEGVISIKKLLVSLDGEEPSTKMLTFEDSCFPFIILDNVHPDITLYHDIYPLYIRNQEVIKQEQKIKSKLNGGIQRKEAAPLPGAYKNLQEYVSIQTLFPAIYGLSEAGANSNQSLASIAKSRQLKAYLMFFEQLLVNSLSQVAHISDLFSTDTSSETTSTYFFQALYQVPDAKYILKAFTDESASLKAIDWERFKENANNPFMRAIHQFLETDEQYKDRKKRAFDHMLARFNIAVQKHPLYLFKFYYDQDNPARQTDLEITWKANILRDIPAFTTYRVKADNYLTLQEDESLVSGFGKKMSLLLHIKNATRRKLSKVVEQCQKQLSVTEPAVEDSPVDKDKKSTAQLIAEELDIVFDSEEPEVKITDRSSLTRHVTFKRQSEALFQSAIKLSNYDIQPYQANGREEFVLLFKHPQDANWSQVSKHPDEYAAVKTLKKTVQIFKEISIESEGFYVLEHLLLKPALQAPQHGFNFVDYSNKILVKQRDWQSFAKREEMVGTLLEIAAAYTPNDYPATVARLQEICTFSDNLLLFPTQKERPQNPGQPSKEAIAYLVSNLRQFALCNTKFYPAFEYTIQPAEEQEIAEDFFNFRMTVIFPSWPARFQDKSFRELTEDMFREECPAHIKTSFLWLSLNQMKTFDELYFNWLKALKTDTDSALTHSLSEKLTRFLIAQGVKYNTITQDEPEQ